VVVTVTDYCLLSLRANGSGLNAYLRKAFVQDSAFPRLEGGDRVLAHPTPGGGVLLLPIDALEAYPITVDSPPDGLVEDVAADDEVATDGDLAPTALSILHEYASEQDTTRDWQPTDDATVTTDAATEREYRPPTTDSDP
jgi:hypothetical protein